MIRSGTSTSTRASSASGFWIERLVRYAIPYEGPEIRQIGTEEPERVISFKDPDGMLLELVGTGAARDRQAWVQAHGIPAANAIHGFHSVTLWVEHSERTVEILVDTLGFRRTAEAGSTIRLSAGDGGPGTIVQVRATGAHTRSDSESQRSVRAGGERGRHGPSRCVARA